MTRIKIVSLLSACALVFAFAQMAGADTGAVQPGDPTVGDPHGIATSSAVGTSVQKVKVVSSTDSQTFTGPTVATVAGATTTVKVKSGMVSLLDIRFSGESDCYDGAVGNYCTAEIRVDGAEANPMSGGDYAIDASMGGAGDYWEGNISERWVKVTAGTHIITVVAYTSGAASWRIDDWTLAVDQIKST